MSDRHKSGCSGGTDQCVEVREHSTGADVRDTRDRSRGQPAFTANAWGTFVSTLRPTAG
ncbi:DUF397 domain-containing protein [Nocardiopsis sp. TSRI0078]|uniref:DUF397 domain-containing protein n=1 Tax=unclassified Nocardiopsis TaxID=2649073 RepID=UPI00093A6CC7|nr:DUF397 domain-containing protein [Nocardiopsis sp. TSRI0078]OKI17474.1 DUF397 domain-containing protein [Nocardiopsis sp. TSRI0078]